MSPGMANPSKVKGDKAERDAVAFFLDATPDLCLSKAKRMLGAGRSEDVGDLYVFPDVAVQVRAYKIDSIGAAVRSSAVDSVVQAGHGDMVHALGMVPFPRARKGTVKWLACTTPEAWPTPLEAEPQRFGMVGRALAWVREDSDSPARVDRIAWLVSGTSAPVLIAPIEAWIAAYRAATCRPEPDRALLLDVDLNALSA